jgi:uncharacterized protein (DUF983 family)
MANLGERLRAIFLQHCPRCLKGKVYHGLIAMYETCPVCGYRFEREQGYFLGAMYASYFLAVPVVGLLAWAINVWIVPQWSLFAATFLATPPFLLSVPLIYRYSRVIWMHIDPPPPV